MVPPAHGLTAGAPPALTVVVMAYNEAQSLEPVVREIAGALAASGGGEVLIVDDGSTDGTALAADRLAAEAPAVRVVHHPENRGLGGVYRTGFEQARGELVTFFPADGQFPATLIPEFVAAMRDLDMALGYLPARTDSTLGRLLSVAERLLYRVLCGPLPRFQGVLMFRRALLERFPLRSQGRGWAVLMELIIRAARGGARARSLPTALHPRRAGASKVRNLRTVWSNLRQIWALRRQL